jgi:hypothetical protein
MSSLDQYPQRDGLYRILPGGVAVHNRYQDRVVMLDSLNSEIWLRADGQTTLREIACDIAGMSGLPIDTMCRTASVLVVIMNSEGVMFASNEPDTLPYHLQHPQEDQDLDRMNDSMAAAGWLDE